FPFTRFRNTAKKRSASLRIKSAVRCVIVSTNAKITLKTARSSIKMPPLDHGLPLYLRAGDEVRQWLRAMAFSHFATFNFNQDTTLDGGKKALKGFLARWDRRVLGKRFNKEPREKRTLLIGFVEHIDSNLHYHSLVRPAKGQGAFQPDFAVE